MYVKTQIELLDRHRYATEPVTVACPRTTATGKTNRSNVGSKYFEGSKGIFTVSYSSKPELSIILSVQVKRIVDDFGNSRLDRPKVV
jgi:ribosomal protein S19E (S16A)